MPGFLPEPRTQHHMNRIAFMVMLACAVAGRTASSQTDSARRSQLFHSITWVAGPVESRLTSVAELRVPSGCRFTDAKGANAFMQATENIPGGNEAGILLCQPADTAQAEWFVVFSYDATGYVRDDERDSLDADAILASLRKSTDEDNEERAKHGWAPLTIDGWVRPPYYDSATHNLTWSTTAHSDDTVINHSVRLLGRGGVLHADLVIGHDQLSTAVPDFNHVIATTRFLPGNTYGEWRQGDKVAAYGLSALIVGGAGVAAGKLGLLGKLWKMIAGLVIALWKALVAVGVAVSAWFRRLFGRKKRQDAPPPPSGSSPA